ncbi:MAG: DMT family transporter [Burkholderiales bacterium]
MNTGSINTASVSTAHAHRRALLLMIGATVCWSSAGLLVRNMQFHDAWEITFWRSVFMVLFVSGWLWQQYGSGALRKIAAVGIPGLISGALYTVMFVGFIVALSATTVANTLIVISIAPFFAALMGWAFLGEKVAGRTWLSMAIAFTGIVLMFFGAVSHDRWFGALVAAIVPAAYGLNIVILRKMHASVDMIPAILIAGVISALVTAPLALPFQAVGRDFVLLAIMGVVQLGLGCILMTIASRALSAAEIGLVSVLETVFGTALVWLLAGEQPSTPALAGGIIVIGALGADQIFAARRAPAIIT